MQFNRLAIIENTLNSRVIRQIRGDRGFNVAQALGTDLSNNSYGGGGGFWGALGRITTKSIGFLLKGTGVILKWAWNWLKENTMQLLQELYYFDWNTADAQIKQEIESNNLQIVQGLGNLLGSGTVYLITISIANGLKAYFPVIAGRVALAVAEEGAQDLKGRLNGLISTAGENAIRNIALSSYVWLRRQIKGAPTPENNKPWVLTDKIDEKINGIQNKWLKSFTQGFKDGFEDALFDVGYIISWTLDDHYEATRQAQQQNVEPIRTIEVFPDKDSEESITITDTQGDLEQSLNEYLTSHALVSNRDVGVIVGQPHEDWYGLKPQARKLIIEFRDKEKPPFANKQGKTLRVQISIPDAKRGLDWNDLKTKIPKYTWGNSWAKLVFENRRFMHVWGATEQGAEQQARALAELSSLKIIQVSTGTVQSQDPRKKKKPTLLYPCFAQMLVRETVINPNNSVTIDSKNRAMTRDRIEIWRDEKPENFKPLR